jgi:hypothetical protein
MSAAAAAVAAWAAAPTMLLGHFVLVAAWAVAAVVAWRDRRRGRYG